MTCAPLVPLWVMLASNSVLYTSVRLPECFEAPPVRCGAFASVMWDKAYIVCLDAQHTIIYRRNIKLPIST